MSDTVIRVENVSKQYRLGTIGTGTLSHDLNRWWHRVRGKEDPYLKVGQVNDRTQKTDDDGYVWALRDINFEVKRGEVLGIIGRNGAGKSTLLKILSRTTTPTTGSVKMKGRIASLLEVGTGFHPELTGRENIFLNGAILGMTKAEIKSKFDEIVDFSGVEKYIDTPVKRYSSGMYVRLAFAVAAHLEPEILIVDEVLAVGDVEFQKKCLGKMKDVSVKQGRTVLFVSHNIAAIKTLCNSGLLLENGRKTFFGNSANAVSQYLSGDGEVKNVRKFYNSFATSEFILQEISLKNWNNDNEDVIVEDEPIELTTTMSISDEDASKYHVTYHLNNEAGEGLFSFSHTGIELRLGLNRLICKFPAQFLQSGTYYLSIFLVRNKRDVIFHEKDAVCFTVIDGKRELGVYMGREPGYIRPSFEWFRV